MTRNYLVRGMVAGVVAGLLALAFAKIFGETWVGQAISFESAHDAAEGMAPGPELVSRNLQSTAGLATGVLVFGIVIGGLFGLVTAIAEGRIGTLGSRGVALVVAGVGFLAMYLVPFLKYPANPPSVGNPDTIAHRTELYFGMIALSVLFAVGATNLARQLSRRIGAWNAVLAGIGLFVVGVAVAMIVLPGINEVPADFPAVVLFRFRIASIGIQVVLWSTLGLLFGWLTERSLTSAAERERVSL